MFRRNKFKKIMAVVLSMTIFSAGCATGNTNKQEGDTDNALDIQQDNPTQGSEGNMEDLVKEGILLQGAGFSDENDGISVFLSTDKSEYETGEKVKYKLVIDDRKKLWNISEAQLSYSVDEILGAPAGEDVTCVLKDIAFGSAYELEGELEEDGEKLPKISGSADIKSFTGDRQLTVRPYVKFDYNGTEVMLRIVIDMNLRQEKLEFSADEKAFAKRTSCHDPGIFKDKDGTYYIFGTHIGLSSSTDLNSWTNMDSEFRESFTEENKALIREWNADGNGEWFGYLWAPDVIWNEKLGKYCMYLSANGDNWISNIVMLTADSATGPYDYAGTVVYGGFTADTVDKTDVLSVTGEESIPERYVTNGIENKKWGDKFPNCIDPCVFFDEDGNLFMSYGSWSGGIFLLELDENTGLRDYSVSYETNEHSDAYFGKKIAGGWYVSGEASFIQKIGDYYYLFVTYGGLSAKEGYNMRVFRSSTPDGEYVDELGNSPLYDSWVQNFNQSIGVRLFGAYKWRSFSTGQVAQGHNSAFVDDDGRAFLIYHTRITDGTESHFVRVHQLFVNENGWLVAAPYHTNGEKLDPSITKEDIAGDYEVMIHRMDIDYENYDVVTSDVVTLGSDGSISGKYTGSWSYDASNCYITIALTGENEDSYKGVALRMKIEESNVETMVFTALGEGSQLTLWGSKIVDR